MSFVRPEAREAVTRWRDVILGVGVLLLGLYWASGFGVLRWVGIAVSIAGALLIYTGLQRLRFDAGKGGVGIVTVDEGQITYFGPLSGGAVSVKDMTSLTLDPTSTPPVWTMRQPGQAELMIPVNAEGADGLFDAFATLPGIKTEYMLAQLRAQAAHPVVIWQKQVPRLH